MKIYFSAHEAFVLYDVLKAYVLLAANSGNKPSSNDEVIKVICSRVRTRLENIFTENKVEPPSPVVDVPPIANVQPSLVDVPARPQVALKFNEIMTDDDDEVVSGDITYTARQKGHPPMPRPGRHGKKR